MSDKQDRRFMELAVEQARKCVSEGGAPRPKVGAVIVRGTQVLATAFRGELGEGEHAEFTALEKKLGAETLAGATVYTTLEPCTTRNHPKVSCAARLLEHKVARVVIGTLDPNPVITGKGVLLLREHNVEVASFDPDLMAVLEELNREFSRAHRNPVPQKRDDGDDKILEAHRRRLQVLVFQAATFGLHAPPHVLTEIEDIRGKIAELEG